jgi:hypothetical protein
VLSVPIDPTYELPPESSKILLLVRRADDLDSWWTVRSAWIKVSRWKELGLANPTGEDRGKDAGKHP